MSSRYRVEYHLKSHRKDEFIDWVKGLLASPFVLHAVSNEGDENDDLATTQRVRSRYAEIFKDIEQLIDNKIEFDSRFGETGYGVEDDEIISNGNEQLDYSNEEDGQRVSFGQSRLNLLVPTIGTFFTKLPLEKAFLFEDSKKAISARRMVAPSFNDVRRILNTAQIFHFIKQRDMKHGRPLKMVTFDGDVTLYEDGGSINKHNPVTKYLLRLLQQGLYVGIVTAAGYDESSLYEKRLEGLVQALHTTDDISLVNKTNLTIMGGESSYLFRYYDDGKDDYGFKAIEKEAWFLPIMNQWDEHDMQLTLDFAEKTLRKLKKRLNLPSEVQIIRKARAVGIVPGKKTDQYTNCVVPVKLAREQLEEIVLTLQATLENFAPARQIQYSCFDGGSDVWCDIGGKDLGVRALQQYYDPRRPILPSESLHVGDQFAPVGSANDFKARLAGCTLWVASPKETVEYLHRLTTRD